MLTFYWLLILNGFVPWICRTCHFQFQQYFIIAIKTCGLSESHHVPTLNWLFKPTLHPQSTVNMCQWGKTSFRTNILSPPQPPTAAHFLNLPLLVSDTSLGLHFQLPLFVLISWSGFLGQAFYLWCALRVFLRASSLVLTPRIPSPESHPSHWEGTGLQNSTLSAFALDPDFLM